MKGHCDGGSVDFTLPLKAPLQSSEYIPGVSDGEPSKDSKLTCWTVMSLYHPETTALVAAGFKGA